MMLRVDGVEFGYRSVPTISDISFSAEEGDVITILGPNGVGKSTLLKCLNRINRYSEGRIDIDEEDISDLCGKEMAKKVGYVPQRSDLSGMTVFNSVLLGRKPYVEWDVNQADIRLVGRAIRLMGLEHLSMKRVDEISGGEYQLVQIARALVQHPRVLLLDEPTGNLDLHNQYMIMESLCNIIRHNGMCAIMTNHDLNLAIRYCNKFIMMKDGLIHAAGGPEIITPENIKAIYGIDVYVERNHGFLMVIPV